MKYKRRLDDQAKIFSLSFNKKDTSVFRLSITLNEKINPKTLQNIKIYLFYIVISNN